MRSRLALVLIAAAVAAAACSGGSSSNATPAARTTRSPLAPTSGATAAGSASPAAVRSREANATPVSPGDTVDVIGVVGTITTDPRAIEITRISGADVNRIEVADGTDIRSAGGGRIDLSAIKTSDRIIAEGRINDRGDALVATQVTVSAVVPGAQPGG